MVPEQTQLELLEFARKLVRKQRRSGVWVGWWKKSPGLESCVVTCQACLLLREFRDERIEKALKKAFGWLSGPVVVANEYSYWRTLPFILENVGGDQLEQGLEQTRKKFQAGVLHHENSPLPEFLVDCVRRAGRDDDVVQAVVEQRLEELGGDEYRNWNPSRSSYVLQNLSLLGVLTEKQTRALVEDLAGKSQKEGNVRWWANPVLTGYVVMNLVEAESALAGEALRTRVRELYQAGVRYLLRVWASRRIRSEPLAGGDFEGTPYAEIVVARALAAAASTTSPKWSIVASLRSLEKRHRRRGVWVQLLLGIVLIGVGETVIPRLAAAVSTPSEGFWTFWERAAITVGIFQFLMALVFRPLFRLFRGMQGS